jgi:hypothetical protein
MTTTSDVDMTEVDESKYGEDLEKGIIGALNSPKVCSFTNSIVLIN